MTYIRLTDGRDRGHVRDVPYLDAQEMLAHGQALPVDMSQPNALAFKELSLPVAAEDTTLPPKVSAAQGEAVMRGKPHSEAKSEPREVEKPAAGLAGRHGGKTPRGR